MAIDPLPTPAGSSPFRLKGSIYLGLVGSWRMIPGGGDAVKARCGDASLTQFAEQIFLASAWYDALPIVPLTQAMSAITGQSFTALVREGARQRVADDLNGVYRLLFRVASPEMVAPRLVRGFGKYFDFGRAETVRLESGRLTVDQHGVPRYLARWYESATATFFDVTLRHAGARDTTFGWTSRADAPVAGHDTVSLRCDIGWS